MLILYGKKILAKSDASISSAERENLLCILCFADATDGRFYLREEDWIIDGTNPQNDLD